MTTEPAHATVPEPRLFVVYLGGDVLPGRMGEDHEVVLVVATDVNQARTSARAKWRGAGRCHVDAVAEIDQVDGHRVSISRTADAGDRIAVDPTYHP